MEKRTFKYRARKTPCGVVLSIVADGFRVGGAGATVTEARESLEGAITRCLGLTAGEYRLKRGWKRVERADKAPVHGDAGCPLHSGSAIERLSGAYDGLLEEVESLGVVGEIAATGASLPLALLDTFGVIDLNVHTLLRRRRRAG